MIPSFNARWKLAFAFLLFVCIDAPLHAQPLSFELSLLPPSEQANVFTITVGAGFPVGSDTEISELSGLILADVGIDLSSGMPVATDLEFTGGLVEASDVSFRLAGGLVAADSMDLGGFPGTPVTPALVTDGLFDASEHIFTVNRGLVFAAGEVIDFSAEPIDSPGLGLGSVSFSPIGDPVAGSQEFEVRLEFPVDLEETIPVEGVPFVSSIDLDLSGTLVATDRLTLELVPFFACDTDLDGDVDAADRTVLTTNWTGALAPGTGEKTPTHGDCDLDADVDVADVTRLISEWTGANAQLALPSAAISLGVEGDAVSNAVVPEPGSWGVAIAAVLCLLIRFGRCDHRRRRLRNSRPAQSFQLE